MRELVEELRNTSTLPLLGSNVATQGNTFLFMQNLLTIAIPAEVVEKAQKAFQEGAALLQPYLTSLTPEERQRMLKMADKTVAFVQKASEYAQHNPAFVPAFVDLKEFEQDVAALTDLTPLHQLLEGLALDTDSTMMLAGSDAYATALVLYNNIKFMAKNKQPGAQAAYDDLSKRFPGSSNAGRKPKALQGA